MSARTLLPSLTGLLVLGFAGSADAHIRLLEPQARYEIEGFDTGIKSCPCGLGGSNRTCNVAEDGSDPDRSTDRVRTYEAGSTITLRFDEYVDHTGSYRVAFDPDGADMQDFDANILVPLVADPSGGMGNTGEGSIWEIEVTLPDMTCDNCTLQLIQAMHGDQVNPVTNPAPLSTYYACIDLELVPPGTLGNDDGDEDPMIPGGGAGGSMDDPEGSDDDDMEGGSSMTLGTGDPVGGSSTPGMGSSMDDVDNTPGAPVPNGMSMGSGSSGGCNVGGASGQAFALLGFAGLCAALSARRRARR